MPGDLELRALLKIDADTSGADKARAALRGVRQEAAQAGQAGPPAAPAGVYQARIPQATLDAIRSGIAGGASPKAAATLLGSLGADAATIAAVTGMGAKPTGASIAAVPAAPRGPGGATLKTTAEDTDKVARGFHLTGNEALRFGGSLIGLGIGLSAFSLAGRLANDTVTRMITVSEEAGTSLRLTAAAFGTQAADLTRFAHGQRDATGFAQETILAAAGSARSLVTDGKLSQDQLKQLTAAGLEYAQIAGVDAATATNVLADAILHGGDAASKLGVNMSDVAVATGYAGGKFATTFQALSAGEQSQIRAAYLFQQAGKDAGLAAKEMDSLPGAMRAFDTATREFMQGPGAGFIDKIAGLVTGWTAILNAGGQLTQRIATSNQNQQAAFEQAQKEMQAKYPPLEGQVLSLAESTARSEEMKARIAQILAQKSASPPANPTGSARTGAGEDYGQAGGPWDILHQREPAAAIVPNPYPQMLDQAQERGRRLSYAVTVAQRESLDLLGRINTAEQATLGPKGDLLDVEYQINRATDHRLELLDQEKVLRATMANQGRQDALQSAQMDEQMLSLAASIRGPGRGEARAALRRFERAQTVPRAELAAMAGELPVTAAQRQARDDAANQQLILLPLQQTAATIQKGADARQHDLDVLNLIREGDKLHADEIVLTLTAQQQANADTAESYRQLIKARDDYFTFGPGRPQPGVIPPPVSFSIVPGPAGAGGAFVINISSAVNTAGGTGDLTYEQLKQIAEDGGAAAAVAAMVAAHQAASTPARATEAGAR